MSRVGQKYERVRDTQVHVAGLKYGEELVLVEDTLRGTVLVYRAGGLSHDALECIRRGAGRPAVDADLLFTAPCDAHFETVDERSKA